MKIGKNMQRLRSQRGWTQKEVARRLSAEPSTYSRWESDAVLPSVYILMDIAVLYGITLDELCGFVTNKDNKLDKYEVALSRLKEADVKFKIDSDIVRMTIYRKSYSVNVSDLPDLISKADAQYDNMLMDINKGLYNGALALILNERLVKPHKLGISDKAVLIEKLGAWIKQHKGKITPKAVIAWVKDDFIFMSIPARKRTWNEILKILLKEKLINKEDKNLWKCPFVEP